MPYLAADHQVGRAICVGSYRENRVLTAVLHVFGHSGLKEMLKDNGGDVLILKTNGRTWYQSMIWFDNI